MDMSKAQLTQNHGSQKAKRRRSVDEAEIKKTKKRIGRYLYEDGVDVNAVDPHSLQRMIPHFSELTTSEIPTREELKGWIFEDAMNETHAYVDSIKSSWLHSGCSILLDGWISANGRNLVNVLVDCPKGTIYLYSSDVTDYMQDMDAMIAYFSRVVTEVGDTNVVQVITNSTSNFMKEVGKLLMAKFPSIFWAVSASDCIKLMLEKMEKMNVVKDTLEKAKIITNFICSHPDVLKKFQDNANAKDFTNSFKIISLQPYITLEDLVVEKDALINIFDELTLSKEDCLTLGKEGRRVASLVKDWSFWGDASTVLKGVFPLVSVMEWLNNGDKEQVGLIYETMDQAQETIKQGFGNRKNDYKPFWKVISGVWNEFLHCPLHAAGYFFNPTLFYSMDFFIDSEVVTGLYACLTRSTMDPHIQLQLSTQLESYRTADGAFRAGSSIEARTNISPALWWSTYGTECVHLQRLAIRILSQTCDSASKFQLKRGMVETLFNVEEDQREQRLIDMVFLHHNMWLQKFSDT